MKDTLLSFTETLHSDTPPESFSLNLKALWYERKGQWSKAHSLVDSLDGKDAARIHGYLHRKEGDAMNAGYWYQQAGIKQPDVHADKEWEMLVTDFLGITRGHT